MKRLTAVVMSAVILFSCLAVPVYGAGKAENACSAACDCGFSPMVYVAGLGSAKIYSNYGTENEKLIFRPGTDSVTDIVTKLLPAVLRLIITRDYDGFCDALIPALNDMLGDMAMDDNGDSKPNVTALESGLPTDGTHGVNSDYYFGYDFRTDPLVTADKLNAYIERVKEITGHEKVNIRASSMGGTIATAYFKQYGHGNVDSIVFQCSPILGTQVAGELLTKKVVVDKDAVVRYAVQALPELNNDFVEKSLKALIWLLDKTGVLGGLADVVNRLVPKLIDRVYDEFLMPVLGKMPGIWAFVTDDLYEQTKAEVLDPVKNASLIERLDEYHYGVQQSLAEIFSSAKEDGVRVLILASYNMQRTPLVESYKNSSDATVDTKYASAGATVALLGETLGEGYVQKVNDGHNHVSADNIIDASTCILPENTWFVKDMLHCVLHEGIRDFYRWFYEGEEDYTVFTNAKYPQFLQNDPENRRLIPIE